MCPPMPQRMADLVTVYVGNVSGLSFLNYLKHALRHHLGPSQFTNEPASEWMLETFDIDISAAPVRSDPVVKRELVECYFIAVSVSEFPALTSLH